MATQSSATKKGTFRRMKQYRCDGFGDCNMVFSRSEHLARHIRKHTGEKPFVCEFPDCGRNFSRFDNMRQHAQIHQRFRKQNYRYPEGIHIQPRPFGLSLGGDQINPRRAIALPSEGQGEGAQTAVAKNQTIVGCGIHNNITRADSPPALPYYSTSNNNSQHGLVSPVSLSGTFEEQQQQQHHQDIKIKQEITDCKQDLHCLTQDELDALDGLNQFQQTPQATSGTTTGPMINTEFD